MIKSMTGYGVGTASNERIKYTVEIKSLNSKFLELNIRLPKTVADKEQPLRGSCAKLIERGKVNLTAVAEYTDPTASAATINPILLEKYYVQLESLARKIGVITDPGRLFEQALGMPEVVAQAEDEIDAEEGGVLLEAFDQAFKAFDRFRKDEGEVLSRELASR